MDDFQLLCVITGMIFIGIGSIAILYPTLLTLIIGAIAFFCASIVLAVGVTHQEVIMQV